MVKGENGASSHPGSDADGAGSPSGTAMTCQAVSGPPGTHDTVTESMLDETEAKVVGGKQAGVAQSTVPV